jgi:quercetin dioxygenase-like cupin family protein
MNVTHAESMKLAGLADYSPGSIVSRSILKSDAGNITLFAFGKGEGLSPHSAPYDAFAYGVDGKAAITIGGKENRLSAGEMIVMPADVPHSVRAEGDFKMLLVMIKGKEKER